MAREIRGGELGRLYRDADLRGHHAALLGLAGRGLRARPNGALWGLVNCGKGEPGQVAHVSHGAAPARFRGVEVGPA